MPHALLKGTSAYSDRVALHSRLRQELSQSGRGFQRILGPERLGQRSASCSRKFGDDPLMPSEHCTVGASEESNLDPCEEATRGEMQSVVESRQAANTR
jgi:hypothetical protein